MKQRTKRQKHRQPENHGKVLRRSVLVSHKVADNEWIFPDQAEVEQISREATLATLDLNPTDLQSLNLAKRQVAEAYAVAARRHGYDCIEYRDHWKKFDSQIKMDWKSGRDKIRREYAEEQAHATVQ